ncbi:hypothetical protein D3C80_1661630 [compost metagenome]
MKAHHFRAPLFDQLTALLIEGRAVGNRCRALEVGTDLFVVGLERLFPASLARRLGGWRLVTEEIQVQRVAWAGCTKGFDLIAHLLAGQHGAGQGAQADGAGNGDGHGRTGRTGHWGLQDRHLDVQQVENAAVGPVAHARLLESGRA